MDGPEEYLWECADAILDRLLDLPEADRDGALHRMGLDAALEDCVRRLLRAHDASGVLDLPTGARPEPVIDLAGRRVGAWVLERELGRGGMSVVWLGRRGEGATLQRAAIKLLPIGVLARKELSRFRREQAILSRLNHPHIAHLYEAGEADDGTPYLAMERVDGERIDVWCDRRELDVHDRVRLMLDVCAAIAYAHRNLVVHADLKPSNVLIDAEGHVRVLDFGIGRLLDEGRTELTGTQWRAVTPEYAAPEQLDGRPAATSADVFGLGALLYRLLTGRAPREHGRDQAFTAPSRVLLRDMDDAQAARCKMRARLLRGDLDTIVLKALKDESEQRYHSVDGLASDLDAWLGQMPITARAPSRRYRIGKFVRRNRLAVAATAAVMLAVVVGVTATLWQARRASAQAAAAKLQAQRAVAVKDVLVTLLQRTDPGRLADDPSVSNWLRMSSQSIRNDHSLTTASRAELLRIIGSSQRARGQYDDARRTLDDALKLYASGEGDDATGYAQALYARSWVASDTDRFERGIGMLGQADTLLGGSDGALSPLHARIRTALAEQLANSGRLSEAGAMAEDVVHRLKAGRHAHRHEYGYALRVLGSIADMDHRPLDAIRWLQASRQAYDPAQDKASLANVDNDLAIAHWDARQLDSAGRDFETAVRAYTAIYGVDHPRTLTVRSNAAALLVVQGRSQAAADALQDLLRTDRRVYAGKPGHAIALDEYWLALARYRNGQTVQALTAAGEARRIGDRLGPEFLARYDTVTPLVGLLRFELGMDDADDALQQGVTDCRSAHYPIMLRRWICLARALRASDRGRCDLSVLPPVDEPTTSVVDRRWWTVYHVLRARCGEPAQRAAEWRAAKALQREAPSAMPPWLRARLATAPGASSAARRDPRSVVGKGPLQARAGHMP